jgi:D-3-phosphoglycerate dehydrogenase / 2-oxoglutarate reductase
MSGQSLKVVITDLDHREAEEEKKVFDRIGAELIWAKVKEEDEIIHICRDADGLLNQYSLLTRRVLENLPRCKAIARFGVGVDSIDLRAATDLGIIVANVPDYCVDEVALQAVTMLLALIRKTILFDQKVKSGQWDFRHGAPIHRVRGKTMGLVGCGKIGSEVAKIVSSLGMRVFAFDPYIQKGEGSVELVDLDTLLKEADFISVHCPLNESTRHLIGENAFRKMRKKPLIVNTSRGPIIEEKALVQALQEGVVSGAGLDVMEKEPPDPGNPLLKMEQVILSPHMSFYSEESIKELKRRTAEGVADVLVGKWPQSVVNSEVRGKTKAKITNS